MSASKSSARKRVSEPQVPKSESKRRVSAVEDEFDAEISEYAFIFVLFFVKSFQILFWNLMRLNEIDSDIKGIMTALKQIKEKAQQDGLKKKEETISR